MASMLGARSKYYHYNTMVCLLKALEGKYITVDLRNSISVKGILISVDCTMALDLMQVTWTNVLGEQKRFDKFFIKGRHIIYVHIPDEIDIVRAMEWQLNKAEYVMNKERGRQRKCFDRKKSMQEKTRNRHEQQHRNNRTPQRPHGSNERRLLEQRERSSSSYQVSNVHNQQKRSNSSDSFRRERQQICHKGENSKKDTEFKTPGIQEPRHLQIPVRSDQETGSDLHSNSRRDINLKVEICEKDQRNPQEGRERIDGRRSMVKQSERKKSLMQHHTRAGHSVPSHNRKESTLTHQSIKKEYGSVDSLHKKQSSPKISQSYWDNEVKSSAGTSKEFEKRQNTEEIVSKDRHSKDLMHEQGVARYKSSHFDTEINTFSRGRRDKDIPKGVKPDRRERSNKDYEHERKRQEKSNQDNERSHSRSSVKNQDRSRDRGTIRRNEPKSNPRTETSNIDEEYRRRDDEDHEPREDEAQEARPSGGFDLREKLLKRKR